MALLYFADWALYRNNPIWIQTKGLICMNGFIINGSLMVQLRIKNATNYWSLMAHLSFWWSVAIITCHWSLLSQSYYKWGWDTWHSTAADHNFSLLWQPHWLPSMLVRDIFHNIGAIHPHVECTVSGILQPSEQ